jgi:hypothetical protein
MNEYVRLGSQMVILSRSFFSNLEGDFQKINEEVVKLRNYCNYLSANTEQSFFGDSHQKFKLKVDEIVENKLA